VWSGLGCAFLVPGAIFLARSGSGFNPTAIDRHATVLLLVGFVTAMLGTLSALMAIHENQLTDYLKKR
jgi:hypothetical protein